MKSTDDKECTHNNKESSCKYNKETVTPKLSKKRKEVEETTLTLSQSRREKVFILTQDVSSHPFLPTLWEVLQILGWSYVGGNYKAPRNSNINKSFSNPIDLTEYLDGKVKKMSRRSTGMVEYEEQTAAAKEMKEMVLSMLFRIYHKDVVDEGVVSILSQETGISTDQPIIDDKGANVCLTKQSEINATTNNFKNNTSIPIINDPFPNKHEQEYIKQFEEWHVSANMCHSLLFTGFGSKYKLLNVFGEYVHNSESCHLVSINGFDTTLESIIQSLFEHVLEEEPTCRKDWNVLQEVEFLAEYICYKKISVYLLVHNIDGDTLRTQEAQHCLSILTSNSFENGTRYVKLMASVDHVDAPNKLWDTITKHNFQFICYDVPTDRRYNEELRSKQKQTRHEQQSKRPSTKRITFESLGIAKVLDNLAQRNFNVLKELASMQITLEEEKNIEYDDLVSGCINKMHIGQPRHMVPVINELEDHKLVKTFRNDDGHRLICIPYSKGVVRSIIDYRNA